MSSTPCARMLALALATSLCAAPLAQAAPWTLHTVLTPPAAAGYGPNDSIAFGFSTAMSADWLAVGARAGFCPSAAGVVRSGSVLLYRFNAATNEYTYTQQVCGTGFGHSVAIWNDWMIVGAPYQDNTPGDEMQNGRVTFLRYDAAQQRWVVAFSADGAADSLMGYSVAIEGGVAAAGESGYNDDRGRVRTWRLDTLGNNWISEGYIYGVTPGQHGATPGEGFGAAVDLDIRNCRAPACTDALDALAVVSRSNLYTFERRSNGWGTMHGIAPAAGTATAFTDVAMNESLAVTTAMMAANDAAAPCATAATRSETRVLRRIPGSAALRAVGFACRDALDAGPHAATVQKVALAQKGREFFYSIPDYPAEKVGVVATWEVNSAWSVIVPTDFVVDEDRTTARYNETGSSFYFPAFTGDYFGKGLSVRPRALAIGAPYYNAFIGALGQGYVAIYRR